MDEICDKLLTVKDIQCIFSIGKNQAYKLMNSDGFPSIKVGKKIYISRNALDEWLNIYKGKTFLL